MEIFYIIILSYLCGSIPFGLILIKIFHNKDIRKVGSGNIGATNVLRTGKRFLAVLTLLLDVLKGFFPVLIAQKFFVDYVQLSALIVFLGHIFPIWLKFKGGKGVATYLGILLALSYPLAILFIFTWIVVLLIFKFSSVSSLFSTLTVLAVTFFRENTINAIDQNYNTDQDIKLILFICFILIVFTHRRNINNLKNKAEHKIKL